MGLPPLLLLLMCAGKLAHAILSFDCGAPLINITTVSLTNIGDCELDRKNITEEAVRIQLLQRADYDFVDIMQCRVVVVRLIHHCGMHSHISMVHNGIAEYLRDVPYHQCKRMQQDGTLSIGNNVVIEGLIVNTTTTRSVTLAGGTTSDGSCTGATYSDPYGSWNDVIVQATLKISLRSGRVPVKIETGKINLRSGTICNLAESYCIDSEDGHTYWSDFPERTCNYNNYDVLYEGKAVKTKSNTGANAPVIYSLTSEQTTFALMKTTEIKYCGYTLFKTEHPKLFILENDSISVFKKTRHTAVENLDIFTYVNSKFVYVERHIRTQMTTLYRDVILQKCELEKQILNQAVSMARLQPDEFAYAVMKQPGYTAITAGEAAHIIKCIPIEAQLRPVNECFNELPVSVRNNSFFITPKTRILQTVGTRRECNRLLPVMYQGGDHWIRFLPKPIDAPAPAVLRPNAKLSWTYMTPERLATSGIYSEGQLNELREHIMFPAERPALLNNVIQGLAGRQTLDNGLSMYNIMDENTLNKIAKNTVDKIWSGFIAFGSLSAGVMGIFIIIRLVKLAIDTLIHGYAIHSVYGCGIHMLAAVWSSMTHLLLHLARNRPPPPPAFPPATGIETNNPIPVPTSNEARRAYETPETEETPGSKLNSNTYMYKTLRQQIQSI